VKQPLAECIAAYLAACATLLGFFIFSVWIIETLIEKGIL